MADLSPLTYGQVIGRFLAIVGDSADPDTTPDAMPLEGTVTLTPNISAALVATASPVPATVLPRSIVCTLDAEGYLTYDGAQSVYLLATDDPALNPTDFTYTASFGLSLSGGALSYAPFSFELPAGATIDLTVVAPVPSSSGTPTVVGPAGPEGPVGPSGYGVYAYANSAEFLADTQTRWGMIAAPTGANWQVDLGAPIPSNYVGPVLTQTQTMTVTADVVTTQRVTLGSSTNNPTGLSYSRRKVGAGAWSTWSAAIYASLTPTGNYEAASKYYVDGKGVDTLTEADFTALTDAAARFGKVTITDLSAFSGLALEGGGTYWFESVPVWTDGVSSIWGNWMQRLHVTDSRVGGPGGPMLLERHRLFTTGADWDAWTSWRLLSPDGRRHYLSTAELNAVTDTEIGYARIPSGADFFGDGATTYYEGQVLVRSQLADGGYGTGLPPVGSGQLMQTVEWTDGYVQFTYQRVRFYDSGVPGWAAWGSWYRIPLPNARPGTDALFYAGAAASSQGWRNMVTRDSASQLDLNNGEAYVAQHWEVMFANLEANMMESGRLQIGSASAAFEGILDAAATDFGARSFGARSDATMLRSGRLEWLPAAAAVDAVAGVHIPLSAVIRNSFMLHATFSLLSGVTTETRLLCGLAATSGIAGVMADAEPSALTEFIGVGYGAATAKLTLFGEAISASAVASTIDVSAAADQTIDIKMWGASPGAVTPRCIISTRTGGAATVTSFVSLGANATPLTVPMSFFLRASAGGTSAQPKLALHRLRLGLGMGVPQ